MAPDVACTGRSFDVPWPIFGKQGLTLAGNISNKAAQSLRLHLVDVTHVLANTWVSLRHHNADGHLQQRNKTFPHYCAAGKAQAGWPVQRCKGRFLSFLSEQAFISWLHLIFIRFSDSLRAVFPFPWQGAWGYVILCDMYLLTKAGTVLFSPFCCHPLHTRQDELWQGAPAHHRHPRTFYPSVEEGNSMGMWGTWGRAGWLNFHWRSCQWGGEGSQDIGSRGDSRTLLGCKVHCSVSSDSECYWANKTMQWICLKRQSRWEDSWSRF